MNLNRKISLAKATRAQSLIYGKTTKLNKPISCQVRAYDRETGELLSQAKSKEDGSYIIFGSNTSANYVVAIDPDNEYNLATGDNIQ